MLKANYSKAIHRYSKTRRWNLLKKYEFKSISALKHRNGLKGQYNCYQRDERPDKTTETSNKDKVNRESVIALLENLEGILGEIIRGKNTAESKAADQKAVARGLKDAEDAIASGEVEIEWYYNCRVQDPIKILAYQKIEKDKYGMTSYEAALQGKQLIEPASPEVQANREAAEVETEKLPLTSPLQPNMRCRKRILMLIYSAVGIGVLEALCTFSGGTDETF